MAQLFPKWTNTLPKIGLVATGVGSCAAVFVVWFWFSPYNINVGYQPQQPLPFSHELHVGQLGMDCRYCHAFVAEAAVAGIPPTQTCMNCHKDIKKDSVQLAAVHQSWATGKPIPWVRVHKIADYAYFDHSVHLAAGVGCLSCHGEIHRMQQVRQMQPLSMDWCLQCHRNSSDHLRPVNQVTNPDWQPHGGWHDVAQQKSLLLHPPVANCSGCHR
ncbi:MAG: cytochrome c3 family protein [Myxococcota bacterium]